MTKEKNIKKPFYKRWWVWTIAIIIIFIMIGGGDDVEEVSKNESQTDNVEEKDVKKENEKPNDGVYEINSSDELLGLEINIIKIEINEKELLVDINLKNITDETMTFYPDQGSAIIGSKQIDANMFMTKGDISGDIHGGVEKEGTIKFLLKELDMDVNEIDEITFKFGNVGDSEYNYEDYSKTIKLK